VCEEWDSSGGGRGRIEYGPMSTQLMGRPGLQMSCERKVRGLGGLETFKKRLDFLEEKAAQEGIVDTEG